MGKLLQFLRLLNILSIDIALGATIGCAFFAKILEVSLLPSGYISLGLAVWIIYTADHLLDVRKNTAPAATERHRFHQRHFNVLLIGLILALVVVGIQMLFIRRLVFIGGVLLSIFITAYFISQRRLRFIKELSAAVLYTAGVLIAPISLLTAPLLVFQVNLIVQFFLTALVNLLLFSLFDQKNDTKDHHPSFTISFGESVTQTSIWILLAINSGIGILQLIFFTTVFGPIMILLLMNAIPVCILLNRKYFEVDDRYRLMGDAAFLLPLIYLLI